MAGAISVFTKLMGSREKLISSVYQFQLAMKRESTLAQDQASVRACAGRHRRNTAPGKQMSSLFAQG
jgi:hypothetical protein